MIMTRNVNKTMRLMGLTIMQASKNFRSNRLLRIFGRPNGISKDFVNCMNNWGTSGYSISARINRRGIQVVRNCKAIGVSILRTTTSISGRLVIKRTTGD